MDKEEQAMYDIAGWATKYDVLCNDGRTIRDSAFAKDDGKIVPVLWHHLHDDPRNVLGHGRLQWTPKGTRVYINFNKSEYALAAKEGVVNGDFDSLSIYATNLKHGGSSGMEVLDGTIKEVSIVLVGANKEAKIDFVSFQHSDDTVTSSPSDVIIHSGELIDPQPIVQVIAEEVEEISEVVTPTLEEVQPIVEVQDEVSEEIVETVDETPINQNRSDEVIEHAEQDDPTVKEVIDSMSDIQKDVMYAILHQAVEGENKNVQHSDLGGTNMEQTNIFEQQGSAATISHADMKNIISSAISGRNKLSVAIKEFAQTTNMAHADEAYGITNIEYLFPEARTLTPEPALYGRDMGWVDIVLNGVTKSPFSRIKTVLADITEPAARARGYIKGAQKFDEVFSLLKRTTAPTTIYKKQKLDQDDVIDIDFDIILYVRKEMSVMIREEIARAILISDGRAISDADKIKDPQGTADGAGIRSILNDDDLYAHHVVNRLEQTPAEFMDAVVRAAAEYRGRGTPKMFMGTELRTELLLQKDKIGRRLYDTTESLAAALGVSEVVPVSVMNKVERDVTVEGTVHTRKLSAIMVHLPDYVVGATKGGELTFRDGFDLDFNQNKFLLEARMCGALRDPKTAIVFERSPEVVDVEPPVEG